MTKKVKKEYEIKTDMCLRVMPSTPQGVTLPVYMNVHRGDKLTLNIERTIFRKSSGQLSIDYECSISPVSDKNVKFVCTGIFSSISGTYKFDDRSKSFCDSIVYAVLQEHSSRTRLAGFTFHTYHYLYSVMESSIKILDAALLDKTDEIIDRFINESENYKVIIKQELKKQNEVVTVC